MIDLIKEYDKIAHFVLTLLVVLSVYRITKGSLKCSTLAGVVQILILELTQLDCWLDRWGYTWFAFLNYYWLDTLFDSLASTASILILMIILTSYDRMKHQWQ